MRIDHLIDQGVGKMNEDAIFLGERRFGVFDGASSLDGYTDEQGRTGGFLAANIAQATFATSAAGIVETALEANRRIAEAMAANGIAVARKENTWCSTMAVVELDPDQGKFEWVQLADSLILVIRKDRTHTVLIEDDFHHDRRLMVRWKEMADAGVEDIRSRLQDDLIELRRAANVNYGVLNGDPDAGKFLRTGSGSLQDVAYILIFSDGMIPPKQDPLATDNFSTLVEIFLKGGLSDVRDHIRAIENSDPGCRKYPRYKKSDDIAAIALGFD